MKNYIHMLLIIFLIASVYSLNIRKANKDTITFAVISDIHFDPFFIDETANEKKLYCRNNKEYVDKLIDDLKHDKLNKSDNHGLTETQFEKLQELKKNHKLDPIRVFYLLMKDSTDEIKQKGTLGVYQCDTNINLLNKIIGYLKNEKFTHLLILGDFIAHKLNKEQGEIAMSYVNQIITDAFKDREIKIFIALGNHDFSSGVNFPDREEVYKNEINQSAATGFVARASHITLTITVQLADHGAGR